MTPLCLKACLDEIISPVQNAFVLGRLITNNFLLSYECLHTIKNKKGRVGYCVVKLGMHKAYDRVDWSFFVKNMMLKLGFHGEIVEPLMACVRSIKYKVRYNDPANGAYMILPLKKEAPTTPCAFRPISLQNCTLELSKNF